MNILKNLLFKYRNYITIKSIVSVFIMFLGVVLIFIGVFSTDVTEGVVALEEEVLTFSEEFIYVDIKGEVTSPGIYKLKYGSRVSDLITLAGGLTDESNTEVINLSKVLNDEDVVIIYSNSEIEESRSGTTTIKYIERECICPILEDNDACINNDDITDSSTTSDKISLNTASLDELMTLSGIGESKALAIIKYRDDNNGFKSIDEILNVSGIGNATYENIKDYITI